MSKEQVVGNLLEGIISQKVRDSTSVVMSITSDRECDFREFLDYAGAIIDPDRPEGISLSDDKRVYGVLVLPRGFSSFIEKARERNFRIYDNSLVVDA